MNRLKLMTNTLCAMLIFLTVACSTHSDQTIHVGKKILVFSKTAGYRHKSIETGIEAIKKKCAEKGYEVLATEDSKYFHEDSLKSYAAVIFLNTTGRILNATQKADFERYIQAGGGFVGIHSASDSENYWPWFTKMVGGKFLSHPKIQEADIKVVNRNHAATAMLSEVWHRKDEWYDLQDLNPDIQVLAFVDETSYKGGKNGDYHPIAWYHNFDGGRVFYTGMGHTKESYGEELFMEHIMGGIEYAMGNQTLDYSKAYTLRKPDDTRFVKKVFANLLDEPMELDIFPDGRLMYIERKGGVRLYDPEEEVMKDVTTFKVDSRYEDGLLGMAIDPNFERTGWVYFYYSPITKGQAIQRLSRFYMCGDSLLMDTEKTILEIPVQREECCHSGGSVQFGPDGLLFLSLGDNTSPFKSDGFNPIDEREGRSPFDAQKSAGNTHDLRGKVLRIKPNRDGSYSIPDGNLFPKDGSGGRPEIYAMGCRNPFRISIDQRNGDLYWGDIGPDSHKDSERGPRGYDEINQARTAGYYGWPYFIANNIPYADFDFETGEIGARFNPDSLYNTSPNNFGSKKLPRPREAFVYYPYAATKAFPEMKTGSRNAMAGPVYYYDDFPTSKNRFPKYYDGKLFIYDWTRGWIKAITFDENRGIAKMEPFLPEFEFSKMIDLELGPDGTFYFIEYGSSWFTKNPDARLGQIDYAEGNREPIARMKLTGATGAVPLTVKLDASKTEDYDEGDEIEYAWFIKGQDEPIAQGEQAEYTFDTPGKYNIELRAKDDKGAIGKAKGLVLAGNDMPDVKIALNGNTRFYWEGQSIDYIVSVNDKEDGSIGKGIEESAVAVNFDFLEGHDRTVVAQGHTQTGAAIDAKVLVKDNGCMNCHQMNSKSVGPSFTAVAAKYPTTPSNVSKIGQKIIHGGNGVWGEREMAAHPNLSTAEAESIAEYIISLDEIVDKSLPSKGTLSTTMHKPGQVGKYILNAGYTDKGNGDMDKIKSTDEIILRFPEIYSEQVNLDFERAWKKKFSGALYLSVVAVDSAIFGFENIDLTDLAELDIRIATEHEGFYIEAYIGGKDGELVGASKVAVSGKQGSKAEYISTIINIDQSKLKNKTGSLYYKLYDTNRAQETQTKWKRKRQVQYMTTYFVHPDYERPELK